MLAILFFIAAVSAEIMVMPSVVAPDVIKTVYIVGECIKTSDNKSLKYKKETIEEGSKVSITFCKYSDDGCTDDEVCGTPIDEDTSSIQSVISEHDIYVKEAVDVAVTECSVLNEGKVIIFKKDECISHEMLQGSSYKITIEEDQIKLLTYNAADCDTSVTPTAVPLPPNGCYPPAMFLEFTDAYATPFIGTYVPPPPEPSADAPTTKYAVKVTTSMGNVFELYELNKCFKVDGKYKNYRAFSTTSIRLCEFNENSCTTATSCEEKIDIDEGDFTDTIPTHIFYAEEYPEASCRGQMNDAKKLIATNECKAMNSNLGMTFYVKYEIDQQGTNPQVKVSVWEDSDCVTTSLLDGAQDFTMNCGECTDALKNYFGGESHNIQCEAYVPPPEPSADAPTTKYAIKSTTMGNAFYVYELNKCFKVDGKYKNYRAFSTTAIKLCEFGEECIAVRTCGDEIAIEEGDFTDDIPTHIFYAEEYPEASCEGQMNDAKKLIATGECKQGTSNDESFYIKYEIDQQGTNPQVKVSVWEDSACGTPFSNGGQGFNMNCGECTDALKNYFDGESHNIQCKAYVPPSEPSADAPTTKYAIKATPVGNTVEVYELNKCFTVDGKHKNYRAFSTTSIKLCEFGEECIAVRTCGDEIAIEEGNFKDEVPEGIFTAYEYPEASCEGQMNAAKKLIATGECKLATYDGNYYIKYEFEGDESNPKIKGSSWTDSSCKTGNLFDFSMNCDECTGSLQEFFEGESHFIECGEYVPPSEPSNVPQPSEDAPKKPYVVKATMLMGNTFEVYELNKCFKVDGKYKNYRAFSKTAIKLCEFNENTCTTATSCEEEEITVAEADFQDTIPTNMFYAEEYLVDQCPAEQKDGAKKLIATNECKPMNFNIEELTAYVKYVFEGEGTSKKVTATLWGDEQCEKNPTGSMQVDMPCGGCTDKLKDFFGGEFHKIQCEAYVPQPPSNVPPEPSSDAPKKPYVVKATTFSGNTFEVYELNKCFTAGGKHKNYRAFSKTSIKLCEFNENTCTTATSCGDEITVAEADFQDTIPTNMFYAEEYPVANCPDTQKDGAKKLIATNECKPMIYKIGGLTAYVKYKFEEGTSKKVKATIWMDEQCKVTPVPQADMEIPCGCTDYLKEYFDGEFYKIQCEEYDPPPPPEEEEKPKDRFVFKVTPIENIYEVYEIDRCFQVQDKYNQYKKMSSTSIKLLEYSDESCKKEITTTNQEITVAESDFKHEIPTHMFHAEEYFAAECPVTQKNGAKTIIVINECKHGNIQDMVEGYVTYKLVTEGTTHSIQAFLWTDNKCETPHPMNSLAASMAKFPCGICNEQFKTLIGGESHMIKCEVYVPPPPPEEDSGSIGISQTMFFLIFALLFFIF